MHWSNFVFTHISYKTMSKEKIDLIHWCPTSFRWLLNGGKLCPNLLKPIPQPTFSMCEIHSKLTIKTTVIDVVLVIYFNPNQLTGFSMRVTLALNGLNRFQTFFFCFHCWLWTSKWRLGRFNILPCLLD